MHTWTCSLSTAYPLLARTSAGSGGDFLATCVS